MTFQHLFTPFRLGHVTLRNRIVSTPHATRFGKGGYITERYIRYHAEKARGGAGLVQCFGSSSVHPSSPVLDWGGIKNWDDSSLPTFEAWLRVRAANEYSGRELRLDGVDTVVLAYGARAVDGLFSALQGRVPEVLLVGDAMAPRLLHDALLEGTRAARQL